MLKPGGRLLLLEITRPTSRIGVLVAPCYFGVAVPLLAGLATRSGDVVRLMRFYWDTIVQCVAPESVLASLRRGGFSPTRTVVSDIFSEYTAVKT